MIIKIMPDREKVKSMLRMALERKEFVSTIDPEKFSTNAAENYYEVIKELATAMLLLDGKKAIGENAHKELLESLVKYPPFAQSDIVFLNDLRIKRNNSLYEGKRIEPQYLKNSLGKINQLIIKLKNTVEKNL